MIFLKQIADLVPPWATRLFPTDQLKLFVFETFLLAIYQTATLPCFRLKTIYYIS